MSEKPYVRVQNICCRSERVGEQGLSGEGNFRVLDFLVGIASRVISWGMAEKGVQVDCR